MRRIALTQGRVALVDDDDFPALSKHKWHALWNGRNWYARGWVKINGKPKIVLMHRLLMRFPKGLEVDHINRNGLDNRRKNLRRATREQNARNQKTRRDNTSGYKGVCYAKRERKWVAQLNITENKKRRHVSLGHFSTKEEAIAAYKKLAPRYHGKYAKT